MPRRPLALLLSALLALATAGPAFAQSAGDEQYQDPFGSSGGGSTQTTPDPSQAPSLSPSIDELPGEGSGSSGSGAGSSGSGSGTAGESASGSSGQATPASGRLAETGVDARVLALLGLALVLGGVGLRLRSADERF